MNSVNTPPSADPNTAPTGAPAEKVANARDRARDGGNACARMPSYIKSNEASRFLDDNVLKETTHRSGYRGSSAYALNSSQNIEGCDICVILGYGPPH